ncbi:XPG domain containing-domain-containing protein [Fusarium tricinctum]|uniref:XPG domain containing-domain-containing protein n=1 Tax=Fusarium tricinctum TaxID=61284 RepID=A0A8K0RTV9_9HYPO|nr:XPG domain containing-domain-containing protein [Fusarium tricinctum]
MGIPRLIVTLEPYVVHGVLDNQHVVIDGPALAYHILYICNRHGIPQPSYKLLGETAIAWFDELIRCDVSVDAIYFDGYLPHAKGPVRMQRMVKSLNQLKALHSADAQGFSLSYFSAVNETSPTLFSAAKPPGRPAPPPSFHVPAIIEALRSSSRYAKLVHLVPGEADAYCAQHVSGSGGTVLTSDSDLLVHDLGKGSVVFLRDIYLDEQSNLACASFSPAYICEKLKLASSAEICRFAYERKCSPHLTLPQLLRDCARPVTDRKGYIEFCHEYLDHVVASIPISVQGAPIQIGTLDPRISEMVLQLGNQDDQMDNLNDPKLFLPILLESPSRGSAWEQSTPIRQLAYTIARWIVPGSASTIQEYRRVNTTVQKGRQVLMLPERAAKARAQDLVRLMSMAKAGSEGGAAQAWHTLCLTLDIRYCREEGKHSHTLQTLEESLQTPTFKRITWDIVHFVAHLQAAYYSFRLLKQILSIAQTRNMLPELQSMLLSLPPLAEFPDVDKTLAFLQSGQADVYRTISRLVPLPDTNVATKPKRTAKDKKRKVSKENAPKSKARIAKPATRNFFDVLSHQG